MDGYTKMTILRYTCTLVTIKINNMAKRLFIETDVLQKAELQHARRTVADILDQKGESYCKEVFDDVRDFAWHKGVEAWNAVKRADEIYGDSSLVPLCGFGSYTGAPVVMDTMMKNAIEEKITGKSLIFLRPFEDINWEQIDYKLLKKCFKKNKLFVVEFNDVSCHYELKPVDVSKMKKW
jgi:hypothetical protein